EYLAEPFGNLRRTLRRAPDSWPANTERRVSSLERASFTAALRRAQLQGRRDKVRPSNFSYEIDCMALTGPLKWRATCSKSRFMRVACAKWGTSWNWIGTSWRS